MPDANPIQPYNYPTTIPSDFERFGHPGKYFKSITCTTGVTNFTGSNFGVGGIVVTPSTTGTASFSFGGTMPLSVLSASNGAVFECSLSSVKVDSGVVYALIRNQIVR